MSVKSIESVYVNGVNLEEEFSDEENVDYDYLRVNDVRGRGMVGKELTALGVLGRPGRVVTYANTPPRELTVVITLKAPTRLALLRKTERLLEILYGENPSEDLTFTFEDEPDREYYGVIADISEDISTDVISVFTVNILCSDPYKYGEEKTTVLPGDEATIRNLGTSITYPTFELTAKKKTTFAMVANSYEEYNLIGRPSDASEEVVDTRSIRVNERGDTLSTWGVAGTEVDGRGTIAGEMSHDGTGIRASDYGSDTINGWHGPALMKEITPIQDFEIEAIIESKDASVNQMYRVEFYAFDENMEMLGKMAVLEDSRGMNITKAEGRFGELKGPHENYPISSRNYSYNGNSFYGMIRMRREGKRFEFYVTSINSEGVHHNKVEASYSDNNDEYNGKLKFIQIHIAKFKDNPVSRAPKLNYIKVTELTEATVDQTPYILEVGDVVTFNHKDSDILVNGEPRSDLKNFGGTFFPLHKGQNALLVTPEDSFDTKIMHQERFL